MTCWTYCPKCGSPDPNTGSVIHSDWDCEWIIQLNERLDDARSLMRQVISNAGKEIGQDPEHYVVVAIPVAIIDEAKKLLGV